MGDREGGRTCSRWNSGLPARIIMARPDFPERMSGVAFLEHEVGMKLGYLAKLSDKECSTAAELGYDCLEVVTTWDLGQLADPTSRKSEADKARAVLARSGLSVSALAVYFAVPREVAERFRAYELYIRFCQDLGVGCIAAMAQSDPLKPIGENLDTWESVFSRVAPVAEAAGVRIAFENWPGLNSALPPIGSVNVAFSPTVWEEMFRRVDSPSLGLEFDPSHLVWQGIDWAAQLVRWAGRIHHVHAKDTEVLKDQLRANGFFSRGWWRYRLPGYGEVDWRRFTSLLKENGYDGAVAVEHEDPVFSGQRRVEGLRKAHDFLRPLM
jgi:sugar phosphate isomerase/epimerase